MAPSVSNFSGVRTFRVLRALKTISTVKGKFATFCKIILSSEFFCIFVSLKTVEDFFTM